MLFGLTLAPSPAQTSSNGQSSASSGTTFSLSAGVDTYSDAASSSCEKGNTSPYAGMDPLACYGVMAPADSAGRCSLSGMTVFRQAGSTCYYCKPITPATPGILVPLDDIAAADRQGYRCGVDQADPNCMAVCTREEGSGGFIPPQGTILVGGPPSPGNPAPGPGPSAPPRPTAPPGPPPQGGRGSNPCQPAGPSGYDFCANPAGTQPAGCVCNQPPGSKGMYREPLPAKPAPPASSKMAAVDQAMSACMRAEVPYWSAQSVQPAYLAMTGNFSGENHETTIAPVIREEIAMALQAQAVHETEYKASNTDNQADATDYLVGWLDHCLYNAGLVPKSTNLSPNDPRTLYSQFLGVALNSPRIDVFEQGWGDQALAPLPMLPPGKKTF